jgi:hypothetical protein
MVQLWKLNLNNNKTRFNSSVPKQSAVNGININLSSKDELDNDFQRF